MSVVGTLTEPEGYPMDTATLFDTGEPEPVRRLEACPACGGPITDRREHREGRCARCIALGVEALRLFA